ncbi:MAG: [FeFe] hydrogenase H-cluster maturation GTPase HydF [Bacillota bacterium]|nr:[FeFe] hydrogenase H-cluster maturation GTPase HydF [Bacillota bacterium]HPZ22309.1 [FeFe] hydrogenase H-cluster maturation GTPase HydF [Bacillota bacterium]HQD19919.1 [FeFe] hydrogenase H-cluster maturation GTPase HydF [Bacillota bacterium]
MHNTPRGNRLHIAIFGRRNVGKSSLINAITNQNIALVSDVAGTTTDPVYKSMEILPIGPVVLIDTAGLDDQGELGALRVRRSYSVLNKADLALIVVEAPGRLQACEEDILNKCREKNLPVIIVVNKCDLHPLDAEVARDTGCDVVKVSAATGQGIEELKMAIIRNAKKWEDRPLIGDVLNPGDHVILVTPIDAAAPKGRLILPQVQTLRDILDHNCTASVCRETELAATLKGLRSKPALVITDSQVFKQVAAVVPADVLLTSFSILYARQKGDLHTLALGARAIDALKPGDKVLMAEACTHHRTEDDIGRKKIPAWLCQHVGGPLQFEWSSGSGYPDNLRDFSLIVHCGGCMINPREMLSRLAQARANKVPIVNYGLAIAHLMGILPRVLSPFPEIKEAILSQEV